MLSFPRSTARRLRTLARKCTPGRTREPLPTVAIVPNRRGDAMLVEFDEVLLRLQLPKGEGIETPLLLPMEAIEAVEGAGDDNVHVESSDSTHTLNWTERGLPRSHQFPTPTPSKPLSGPPLPKSMAPVPGRFLTALHEAGRAAAREPQRYALNRVQIRGAPGEVIGTDARFVARFEGFTFPFSEEILVPALPLFGLDEWSRAGEVRVGRTLKVLLIAAGEITV